ncbi:MAG: hypothetical protein J0J10_24285 [Bosea sp.]|uniref:hypothetical protein n=1 Tax=Bosea sp. (in: a-proteobacteria) TaxID=1871050 RepID=UPI001AC7536D|nr:hypothetical protein [Bosea sp. (in: a-proteobacteria)]MBN9471893.1 hypothetical protein [Bosea sp. (in: a-proteobacteria)]
MAKAMIGRSAPIIGYSASEVGRPPWRDFPLSTDIVEKVGHLSAAAGRRIWPIEARLLMRP